MGSLAGERAGARDRVLAFEYGHFSAGFASAARNLGLAVDLVPLTWGTRPDAAAIIEHLRPEHRAVLLVHNETSTGVRADVRAAREAMDRAKSEALLIVDTVSSLASMDFRFDDWRVDIALTGSQKGLMLPPGLALLCVSPRAIEAAAKGGSPRNFFDWRPILEDNAAGFFPYTPATLLLFGLREALDMLLAKASRTSSRGIAGWRTACAPRSARGAWGSCVRSPTPTRTR